MKIHDIPWPENEPKPRSMEEALALGWNLDYQDELESSDDERIETGVFILRKDVGLISLHLKIPFRADFTFEPPRETTARIGEVEKEAVEALMLSRLRADLDPWADDTEGKIQ